MQGITWEKFLSDLEESKDMYGNFENIPPADSVLDKVRSIFEGHRSDTPLPIPFPTLDGCLFLEWHDNDVDVSLEINADGTRGVWCCVNFRTNEDETFDIEMDETGWQTVMNKLNSFPFTKT